MSRYYSGGRSRPRGGYHRGGGRGGFYDNNGSRFHRERRDYGSSVSGSRAQLEIARKLVDTLLGDRQSDGDGYGRGRGGGGFRRSRDSFDRFEMSGGARRYTSDYRATGGDAAGDAADYRRHSFEGRARRSYRARGYGSAAPRRDFQRTHAGSR